MDVRIHESWKAVLQDEFEKAYFQELTEFVRQEYIQAARRGTAIYPEPTSIFASFEACPFDQVKVVILGQDPYHGPGQANGLCFSVNEGVARPPSLQNIFKEIASDTGEMPHQNNNLARWATQGVLLLNATLTVEAARAGSHQRKGWEQFTDRVVSALSQQREGLVFLLWGRYAQEKGSTIDAAKHLILKAPHPSPLSSYSGFFGCKHFSQTNTYLKGRGKDAIDWR